MDKIKNFKSNALLNLNNEKRLSILERLPSVITWSFKNIEYKIENDNKIIAVLLKNTRQIAIIEAPFEKKYNQAYITNAYGEIDIDISELFIRKFASLNLNETFQVIDVYYIHEDLWFFLIMRNTDFRIKFNVEQMQMGDLIESR